MEPISRGTFNSDPSKKISHTKNVNLARNWQNANPNYKKGASLEVQWLRLCVLNAGGPNLIPMQLDSIGCNTSRRLQLRPRPTAK